MARTLSQIDEGYALFVSAFQPEELEREKRFHLNVQGEELGGKFTQYRLFLVRDVNSGLIVAAFAGNVMDMGEGESVFLVAYAVTRPQYQGLGLLRELFVSSLMQAEMDAKARGEKLILVLGECTECSIDNWSSLGLRQLWLSEDGQRYSESRFTQPALFFDLGTGQPGEGAGVVTEHLMLRPFDCLVTKWLVFRAVQALFMWCARRTPDDFHNEYAYETYRRHFDELLSEFFESLFLPPTLCLFTAQERIQAQRRGAVFR